MEDLNKKILKIEQDTTQALLDINNRLNEIKDSNSEAVLAKVYFKLMA